MDKSSISQIDKVYMLYSLVLAHEESRSWNMKSRDITGLGQFHHYMKSSSPEGGSLEQDLPYYIQLAAQEERGRDTQDRYMTQDRKTSVIPET